MNVPLNISTLPCLGLAGLALASCSQSVNQDPPNIILILADDMGYSDIGCLVQR